MQIVKQATLCGGAYGGYARFICIVPMILSVLKNRTLHMNFFLRRCACTHKLPQTKTAACATVFAKDEKVYITIDFQKRFHLIYKLRARFIGESEKIFLIFCCENKSHFKYLSTTTVPSSQSTVMSPPSETLDSPRESEGVSLSFFRG